MKENNINSRALGLFLFSLVIFGVFFTILFRAQIKNSDKYISTAQTRTYTNEEKASRGVITDCKGNTLVYNEQINMLTLNYLSFPQNNDEINEEIIKIIEFLEKSGEEWVNNIPLEFNKKGKITYREDKKDEYKYLKSKDMLDVNDYATAEDCLTVLKEKYNLSSYTDKQALKISAVRYGMQKNGFSAEAPYTIAENVSMKTIAYLKENNDIFKGVDYSFSTVRRYIGDGTVAAHILGLTGKIDATEYAEKKNVTKTLLARTDLSEDERKTATLRAYSYNDIIGKSGIEYAMEDYLRGTNGEKTTTVNGSGEITEAYSVRPETGSTVQLTLDLGMQEVTENSLQKRISAVTDDQAIKNGMSAAGAVVVLDVRNAAVLAMASYPDYSLTSYYSDFDKLSKDPATPLWNRATQNTYSPGSTMKPVIAIAALEEDVIKKDTYVSCTGQYKYIDQIFACYNKTAHGAVNVATALEYSCNIFFFEMARRLGITKMNEYAELFGLGEKTGIEISESKGIVAGLKEREEQGLGWKSGETLLAAIGQSDNSFTILQLANYCATIANGGTRYEPYLVNKVLSADCTKTLYEHEPVIARETNIKKSTFDIVRYGMYLVANSGSCRPILGNLKYKVACKTGTAEKSKIIKDKIVNGTDGFLITFGPYEDPEIAICVCIENAGSGSSTAQVAADIYNYYFAKSKAERTAQKENTITW